MTHWSMQTSQRRSDVFSLHFGFKLHTRLRILLYSTNLLAQNPTGSVLNPVKARHGTVAGLFLSLLAKTRGAQQQRERWPSLLAMLRCP